MDTKDKILYHGKKLFMERGIKSVSIKDICQEAKVSRVTFYKYFDNKQDMFFYGRLRDINRYIGSVRKIYNSDKPFKEKVREYILFRKKHHTGTSNKYAADIVELSPDKQEILREKVEFINQEFIQFITQARNRGDISSKFSAGQYLALFNIIVDAANNNKTFEYFNNIADMVEVLLTFYFYGIKGEE
jgi:AcrR family transcriptional regulator